MSLEIYFYTWYGTPESPGKICLISHVLFSPYHIYIIWEFSRFWYVFDLELPPWTFELFSFLVLWFEQQYFEKMTVQSYVLYTERMRDWEITPGQFNLSVVGFCCWTQEELWLTNGFPKAGRNLRDDERN